MGATWWEITFTGDPTDDDLEHVAEMIKAGFTSGQLISDRGPAGMTRQETVNWFKQRYQRIGDGSPWLETSDIEEAVDIATVNGLAYLGGQVITYSEAAGYATEDNDRAMWVYLDRQGQAMTETALCGVHEADRGAYEEMSRDRLNVHDWNGKPRTAVDGIPGLACTVCGYVQPEVQP